MSGIYLKRARQLETGDVILLAGPVYVRPERIIGAKRLPDLCSDAQPHSKLPGHAMACPRHPDGCPPQQIVELTFESEPGVLGFPLDRIVTTLDPLEPWPA